jgi:aminoglycoside phosphotransferase family enzyme
MRFTDGARLRQQWLCPGTVEIPTALALNELIKLIKLSSSSAATRSSALVSARQKNGQLKECEGEQTLREVTAP